MEKENIERWDLIDYAIFDLIQMLNPTTRPIEWDIRPIREIREVLVDLFVDKLKLCHEEDFYP
jgi:hypothetical protein